MSSLLYSLPLLACPVGMGLMMWMMMRSKNDNAPATPASSEPSAEVPSPVSVELLREEHRRLGEHIESLEASKRVEASS